MSRSASQVLWFQRPQHGATDTCLPPALRRDYSNTSEGCCASATWKRFVSDDFTEVSSSSSRAAAACSGSFSSTKPPGSAHWPCTSSACRLTVGAASIHLPCVAIGAPFHAWVHTAASLPLHEIHTAGCGVSGRLQPAVWPCGSSAIAVNRNAASTLQGGFLRWMSSSWSGWPAASGLDTMAASTVTDGRGYLQEGTQCDPA